MQRTLQCQIEEGAERVDGAGVERVGALQCEAAFQCVQAIVMCHPLGEAEVYYVIDILTRVADGVCLRYNGATWSVAAERSVQDFATA